MIVAVVAVGMVEMTVHKIIDMIAMRHRGVAAPGSVDMVLFVAYGRGPALGGIGLGDGYGVLCELARFRVLQMPVAKITQVTVMPDGEVAASRAMLVSRACHKKSFRDGSDIVAGIGVIANMSQRTRPAGAFLAGPLPDSVPGRSKCLAVGTARQRGELLQLRLPVRRG